MNVRPLETDAPKRKGTASTSDKAMTRRGPNRSAAGPPMNPPMPLANRYAATAPPAYARETPCRVSITGMNVANAIDVIVLSTTMR